MIFLRRTALPKDRNGDQGSVLTTPALLSIIFGAASIFRTFKSDCRFCNFPRFQLLLRMP